MCALNYVVSPFRLFTDVIEFYRYPLIKFIQSVWKLNAGLCIIVGIGRLGINRGVEIFSWQKCQKLKVLC